MKVLLKTTIAEEPPSLKFVVIVIILDFVSKHEGGISACQHI